jgi:hypothetical protein
MTEPSATNPQPAEAPASSPPPPPAPPPRKPLWRRLTAWLLKGLLVIVLLVVIGWSWLAVLYTDLSVNSPRTLRAAAVAIIALASLIFIRPRRWGVAVVIVLFLGVVVWFLTRPPRSDRDWAPEYVRVPSATLEGDRLTIHDVRNFDYRGETDFTPQWYDHTYDLSKLKSVDYLLSYWGPKAIAHGMVAFEFDGDRPLAISVETRREKHESYSAVQGFFRQYELIYIFADERDLLRLRTNFRGEDVYLYRTRMSPKLGREFLLDYIATANRLAQKPDWYNAGTSNCSTNILGHLTPHDARAKFSIWILLNGYSAQNMYDRGGLDQGRSFAELKKVSHINAAAKATAHGDADFSARIRAGIPEPVAGPASRP